MENKRDDGFEDIIEFAKKYDHYTEDGNSSTGELTDTPKIDVSNVPEENSAVESASAVFEDISSYSENYTDEDEKDDEETSKKKAKNPDSFFRRNNYRNAKITAIIVAVVILLTGGGITAFIIHSTSGAQYNDPGLDYNDGDIVDDIVDDDVDFQSMGDVDANSLNDFLYRWANNGGEKMYSKNVINVLLCGIESRKGDASIGNSDSMILISVDKKNKKITMTSLLRDSWSYIKVPKSDGSTKDYYFKMNAAYNRGGPATLIETIENNYKIKIDQYIAVDFTSFPKLIDALGGVTVEVLDYEAKYIRRTSSQKDFPSGVATLNGTQALIYSRIRKCDADSDLSRTRRQRTVIKSLINSAKTASKGQLLNAFKQAAPYLRTGYSQSEVISLIAKAYAQGWMDFEMQEMMLPNEDYVDRLGTYINPSCWAWVVDYALCAQKLQTAIYGKTNIVLSEDRTSALDFFTKVHSTTNSSSGGSSSGSQSDSSTSTHYYTTDHEYDNDNENENSGSTDSDISDSENTNSGNTDADENKGGFDFGDIDISLPSFDSNKDGTDTQE